MQQSASFLEALKRCLKAKGLTYAALAERLDLSEASVKRVFAAGTLSLERIGQILEVLDMSFLDVAKLSAAPDAGLPEMLTYEQESVLAADSVLFAVFHLLLFGKSPEDVQRRYDISHKEIEAHLGTLAAIGLIDRHAPRIKLLTGKAITWRDDGPLRQAYQDQVTTEFLSAAFDGERETSMFMTRSLSPSSQALIQRKIERLRTEIEELSAVDRAALKGQKGKAAGNKTTAVALLLAMRPFTFSVVNALKPRPER